jgi:hypothetical protein
MQWGTYREPRRSVCFLPKAEGHKFESCRARALFHGENQPRSCAEWSNHRQRHGNCWPNASIEVSAHAIENDAKRDLVWIVGHLPIPAQSSVAVRA